jgi:hypothetical protein
MLLFRNHRLFGMSLVATVLTCGLLQTVPPASAGGITACDAPFVFEGSAANIVPLEYLATIADRTEDDTAKLDRLQETAQRLTWLVKLDSWHQPTYGSLGVVAHLYLGQVCDPDDVLGTLINVGGASEPVRPGQIVIFLHGKLFIDGDRIFLQSRMRAFRRNERERDESLPLTEFYEGESVSEKIAGAEQALLAELPLIDVTFAPREMTEELFRKIDETFTQASRVHDAADPDSHSEPLTFDANQPRAFSVRIPDEEGWIYIEDKFGGVPEKGYIKSDPEASALLHDSLPELDFMNGVLGILRLQQTRASDDFPPIPDSSGALAARSLDRFLESERTAEEREARALAYALKGLLVAVDTGDWRRARESFLNAAILSPAASEYRNLMGVTDAALCCSGDADPPYRDPARWFADSLSLSPENGLALANLRDYLSALSRRQSAPEGISTEGLSDKLAIIDEVVSNNPELLAVQP